MLKTINFFFAGLAVVVVMFIVWGGFISPAAAFSLDFLNDASTGEYVAAVAAAIIAVAAAVSAIFPSVSRNPIYNLLMKVVNYAALNFGKARNADDPPA